MMKQVSSNKDQVSSNGADLSERLSFFGKTVVDISKRIKVDHISRPLITQLVRSATSVGANYCEAQNAVSRKDFRNKIYIAKKEAQETKYWLHMLESSSQGNIEDIKNLQIECHQIVRILQAIATKLELNANG